MKTKTETKQSRKTKKVLRIRSTSVNQIPAMKAKNDVKR